MTNRVRAMYFGIWCVVVVVSYALLGVLPALGKALWIAALYLLLTLPVRSLRVLAFVVFFFVGLIAVSHVMLLSEVFVGGALSPMGSRGGEHAHVVLLAPISEETVKLVAVADCRRRIRSEARRLGYRHRHERI